MTTSKRSRVKKPRNLTEAGYERAYLINEIDGDDRPARVVVDDMQPIGRNAKQCEKLAKWLTKAAKYLREREGDAHQTQSPQ